MESPKVILVVDDDVLIRDLICTVLNKDGHEVLPAADGYEAVELSRRYAGTIDLLLTDIEMPKMNGIAAYRQISSERAGIKVLFVTGSIPESLALPPELPVLPKPFFANTLRTTVESLFSANPS